ncbi:MAG: hypothetical protein IAE94_06570 [Chthoniobacterales bacterium]|nr:hypothetical protein [Chthoniobacterales bacterium]
MSELIPRFPNSAADPTEDVTDAWLTFVRDPNSDLGRLREQIEAMVGRLLYPRTLGGFFDGFFEHIAREATLLTLSRFLAGNKKLLTATGAGNRQSVNAQLIRSIWLAMQVTMWRTRSLTIRGAETTPGSQELKSIKSLRRKVAALNLSDE